jgi:hypothetical protein
MALTRSNPRTSSFDELLPFLAIGGVYVAARNGILGNDLRNQIHTFEARLRGGATGALNPGGGSGGVGGALPSSGAGPCNAPPFVSGVQYVDARPDGRYGCVVGGQVRGIFGSLAEAESCYRRAFGCAG